MKKNMKKKGVLGTMAKDFASENLRWYGIKELIGNFKNFGEKIMSWGR